MTKNMFTLENLRDAADKQFAPVKIGLSDGTEVTLKNLLRLNKQDRELVKSKFKVINPENDESDENAKSSTDDDLTGVDRVAEAASEILSKVASDPRKLLKELDGDVGLILQVLETWMAGTQPGEAQSSPS